MAGEKDSLNDNSETASKKIVSTRNDGVQPPKKTLWYRFIQATFYRGFIAPIAMVYLDYHIKPYMKKLDGPHIIVHNHTCDYDFVGTFVCYPRYVRYIISDMLTRKRFLKFFFNFSGDFICRRKGESADDVVESIKLTAKAGLHTLIAAEGEETPNGVTAPVRRRTGRMIHEMPEVGILSMRLEGGYFVRPPWAKNRAKGPMFAFPVREYPKEVISKMTPEEINDLIYKDIYVNHYEWQRQHMYKYDREDRAECMERVLYTCPKCHAINKMHSEHDTLSCKACGYSVDVDEYGFFVGDGLPFDNLYDWDMWQKEYLVSQLPEWEKNPDEVITYDEHVKIQHIEGDEKVVLDPDATVKITYNNVIIEGQQFSIVMPMKDIHGIAKTSHDAFGISYGNDYYQVKAYYPISNRKYRVIRKIIIGDPDY